MRKVVVLHDSPDFGGHEVMFSNIFERILAEKREQHFTVCVSDLNHRFLDRLRALQSDRLEVRTWPYAKRRAEPYLWRFRTGYRAAVRRLHDELAPATWLLVQGRIESLVVPMLTLPREARVVSYVPMAHSLGSMGRSPIGDRARRRLYARPDRYIVPSQAVADQIERMGGRRDRVAVVRNAIPETAPQNREDARRRLGLPADAKVALFVGRLDVRQKGIDLLKQALLRRADWSRRWMLVVVGDGPGRPLLSDPQFGDRGLEVRLAGWSSDVGSFLAAADLVLMPSRWEGVPLVMLEAIAARVPILGSDIDVFREYLPASHRADFASADVPLLMDALTTRDAVGAYAADMKQRGLVWTLDDAGRAFSAALDG